MEPVKVEVPKSNWTPPQAARCSLCQDNGTVIVVHIETGGQYAFRCYCPRGLSDWRKFPLWDRTNQTLYKPPGKI